MSSSRGAAEFDNSSASFVQTPYSKAYFVPNEITFKSVFVAIVSSATKKFYIRDKSGNICVDSIYDTGFYELANCDATDRFVVEEKMKLLLDISEVRYY